MFWSSAVLRYRKSTKGLIPLAGFQTPRKRITHGLTPRGIRSCWVWYPQSISSRCRRYRKGFSFQNHGQGLGPTNSFFAGCETPWNLIPRGVMPSGIKFRWESDDFRFRISPRFRRKSGNDWGNGTGAHMRSLDRKWGWGKKAHATVPLSGGVGVASLGT